MTGVQGCGLNALALSLPHFLALTLLPRAAGQPARPAPRRSTLGRSERGIRDAAGGDRRARGRGMSADEEVSNA